VTAVLIPTASEAEWLEARRQGVTASEIAIIMGLSPYSSPYALYHQKLGLLPQPDDSGAMERGRVLEPYVAGKFAAAHPELLVTGDGRELFAHEIARWQMATPDRRAFAPAGEMHEWELDSVVECKVDGGSDEWGEEGTGEIPVHYRAQVLWQCDVLGARRWHVACQRVRDWKTRFYTGEIDDDAQADLELMRHEALGFLKRLENGDPPDVDWRPATADALRTLYRDVDEDREVLIGRQLSISYRAAVKRYKKAEKRKDEMTARLLAAMGTAQAAVDPLTHENVAVRSVSHPRRISPDLLRARYPAIAAECTPEPKPVVKLTPARAKKEKAS
jgi:putative phage-type endonuclease